MRRSWGSTVIVLIDFQGFGAVHAAVFGICGRLIDGFVSVRSQKMTNDVILDGFGSINTKIGSFLPSPGGFR